MADLQIKSKMAEFWADAKKHAPELALDITVTAVGVIGGLWAWPHVKKFFK